MDTPVSIVLILVPSGASARSPGVVASQQLVMAAPGLVVSDGEFRLVQGLGRVERLPTWTGYASGVTLGSGDTIAMFRSTGVANVRVSAAVEMAPLPLRLALPLLSAKARIAARQRSLSSPVVRADGNGGMRVRLVAEVVGADGERVRGKLLSSSGTKIAAHATVATLQALTDQRIIGTRTVFQALGDTSLGAEVDPQLERLP